MTPQVTAVTACRTQRVVGELRPRSADQRRRSRALPDQREWWSTLVIVGRCWPSPCAPDVPQAFARPRRTGEPFLPARLAGMVVRSQA